MQTARTLVMITARVEASGSTMAAKKAARAAIAKKSAKLASRLRQVVLFEDPSSATHTADPAADTRAESKTEETDRQTNAERQQPETEREQAERSRAASPPSPPEPAEQAESRGAVREDGQVAHCGVLAVHDELIIDLGVPPRGERVVDGAAPPRGMFQQIKVRVLEEGPRLVREGRRE